MEEPGAAPQTPPARMGRLARRGALTAIFMAGATVALLTANALFPSPKFVELSQGTSLLTAAAGIASVVLCLRDLGRTRPDLRVPLLFLVILTVGVFAAHIYVVNSPATTIRGDLSGVAGTTFTNAQISASSSMTATRLEVDINNRGSGAISFIVVSLDGSILPQSGFDFVATPLSPIQPLSTAGLGYPTGARGIWNVSATNTSSINISYDSLNCYHVPSQSDNRGVFGCVMDETYYVPSAMGMISGVKCSPYADTCNMEHPPLAKALIAAGIAVFGVNDFGWRISNIILGTLSIPLLFALASSLTPNKRLAYVATLLFAADLLFFVHSSTAQIDVAGVFFSLAGFISYFRPAKIWKLDNYMLSGVFLGLATLSKETAVFAVAAMLSYELVFGESGLRKSLYRMVSVVAPAGLIFAGGLQLYDSLLTQASSVSTCLGDYPFTGTFIDHIRFMLGYGGCLKGPGWTDITFGTPITPLNWLLYYTPVGYLVTTVSVTITGATTTTYHYISVGFYGTTNPLVTWLVFAWVPVVLYRLIRTRRLGATPGSDDRMGGFLLIWFLWAFLPYIALFLYGRVTYPFYILPAVPALAGGGAYFMTRDWFPRVMIPVYIAFAFLFLFFFFPVKDFLPDWVRVILGR